MPFITVTVAGHQLVADQVVILHRGVTGLMADVLGKKAELTAVLVQQAPVSGWAIGGRTVSRAAHLDAKVTEGTNTPEEKARFITQAHSLLRQVAGDLPLATYVVVHDVRADSWGYGGETQEHRAKARARP